MTKLYVGTYTRPAPYLATTNGEGLYVLEYDEASGSLSPVQTVTGIENPSYLCLSPDGRNLHAAWEMLEWPEGLVSSYAVDPADGTLTYQGVQGSKGTLACYTMMDSQARVMLLANYLSGTVALFPVRDDGSLGAAADVDQHAGTGPVTDRQEGPHAHCIVISGDDRFAYSADLGADRIYGYRIDYEGARLEDNGGLDMPAGSGPRHFVLAPDGRHAYVISELASTISALAVDPESGALELLETQPMVPADFTGESHCADIRIHPSGRFVYGSNRGHDSIAMFAIGADGRLQLLGHRSTEGQTPRNFAISPDGRFLLVANQDSDTIVTMPIDQESGELGATSSVADVPTPVCLAFAPEAAS